MKLFKLALLLVCGTLFSNAASANWFTDLFKDTYTQTKYPIVLVHGFSGFDSIAGVDYFYQIPQELRRSGAQVFVAQVSSLNTSEIRGEQLAREVEAILAATGAKKVNLIGHSQGGPTSRYVASVYPQYVASVSTVGGANWGTRLADAIAGVTDPSSLATSLVDLSSAYGSLIDLMSGGDYPQDMVAAMHDLTTNSAISFNAKYPEGMPSTYCGAGQEVGSNGVRYYSWGGDSSSTDGVTTGVDPSDLMVAVTSLVFPDRNDGIVSSCSSHLGRVIRDNYYMNHLDEVNQVLGLHSLLETDPVTVYRTQANRLKSLGL